MIRMIQSSSSAQAKSYFSDALQKSDYYINDQELQGHFHGALSGRLGISGAATKDIFFSLCENIDPVTGKPLTPRHKDDRTVGYDINFHCPKSVSIIHALSKDDHILKAFQNAVSETMKDIEADAMTRVRKRGQYEDRYTRELIWAEFTHQTARPVSGFAPDMHLHSHCFVFNATWDEQEQQVKAGQFRDIKRDMPYYQARYHKKLSDNLIELGYQVRLTDKSFEIDGVPQSVIDLFSKRTNEIGQIAKEKGITDAQALGELGAKTRAKKQKGLSMAELKAEWKNQIDANVVYENGERDRPIRYGVITELPKIGAKDCVDFAVKHSFERASVMADRRVLAAAYKHSIGANSVKVDDITNSFNEDNRIIHVKEKYRNLCTTKEVLAEEKMMVDLALKGQGKFRPIYSTLPEIKSEGQQKDALEHILTTQHQASIVRGAAGSGKTTLLKEADELIKKAGYKPFYFAPSADASRGVLASEGFENAETVARLLVDKELQKELKGQVLFIDEAGLLGTKHATALLTIADQQQARIIFVGDTRQHTSVVRGDALRILNTVGGIQTAEVNKIRRQRDLRYRAAVEDLSRGDIRQAFDKLTYIGAVKKVDSLNPNEKLVADYMKAVRHGKSALMVSPTHQQGEAVTKEIREKLKASGMLGKKELKATRLQNLNYTEAEKTDWRSYQPGQVIRFNQNAPNFKRGSVWKVQHADKENITVASTTGVMQKLPQDKADRFNVFNPSEIELAKGDKVKITHNGFDEQNKRLNNGDVFEVSAIGKAGQITLISPNSKSTYLLHKDFGHIDHAYCSTSHSSQGKTVDDVFISQPASTFTATDAKQFYVSVSRGRDAVSIYTDDPETLLAHASELGDRQSAMELVNANQKHVDYVLQNEREKQAGHKVTPPDLEITHTPNSIEDYEPGL